MVKFHVSPSDGVARPCNAGSGPNSRGCKYGLNSEQHYATAAEAQKQYEKEMTKNNEKLLKISKSFTSTLKPKKNGSYYGIDVNEQDIKKFIDKWRENIEPEKISLMEQNKIDRDKEYAFHATIIKPNEVRLLKKNNSIEQVDKNVNKEFKIKPVGVGSVIDEEKGKETWFIVCQSEEINAFRQRIGLDDHDVHITLGFIGGDIHNQPKNSKTIKF